MKRGSQLIVLAVLVLIAAAALAQVGGGRDSGSTAMGRRGYMWQTDIELAKEALNKFQAELERMDEEEWKGAAIAWLAVEVRPDSRRISVAESHHVGGLAAGKRAEVEKGGAEWEPAWEIAYPKKVPKVLEVTMDDINSTQVDCSMGEAAKVEKGLLGVFIHEGTLVCVFRPAEEGQPA